MVLIYVSFVPFCGQIKMSAIGKQIGGNVWLSRDAAEPDYLAQLPVKDLEYEVMPSEEAVGRAMLDEIKSAVADERLRLEAELEALKRGELQVQ